jgi:hypothetical protein
MGSSRPLTPSSHAAITVSDAAIGPPSSIVNSAHYRAPALVRSYHPTLRHTCCAARNVRVDAACGASIRRLALGREVEGTKWPRPSWQSDQPAVRSPGGGLWFGFGRNHQPLPALALLASESGHGY